MRAMPFRAWDVQFKTSKKETIMIRDILSDIFSTELSFGNRCLAAFIILIILGLLVLVGLFGFVLVDSVRITPTKTAVVTVEEKQVIPTYTSIIMICKVVTTEYHPESYQLRFKVEGKEIYHAVEKKFFDNVSISDIIEVDYGFRRLSKSLQPTRIRLAGR